MYGRKVYKREKRMRNTNIHIYYNVLKKLFPRINYKEGRFLRDFKKSLSEYGMSHPNCSYEDLVENFGTPQDVVAEYLTMQDSDYILKCIQKKNYMKHIIVLIVITLLIAVLIFSIFCFLAYKNVQTGVITYGDYDIVTEADDPNETE